MKITALTFLGLAPSVLAAFQSDARQTGGKDSAKGQRLAQPVVSATDNASVDEETPMIRKLTRVAEGQKPQDQQQLKFFVFRHGQSQWNARKDSLTQRLWYGFKWTASLITGFQALKDNQLTNAQLTESGVDDAKAIWEFMDFDFARWSPAPGGDMNQYTQQVKHIRTAANAGEVIFAASNLSRAIDTLMIGFQDVMRKIGVDGIEVTKAVEVYYAWGTHEGGADQKKNAGLAALAAAKDYLQKAEAALDAAQAQMDPTGDQAQTHEFFLLEKSRRAFAEAWVDIDFVTFNAALERMINDVNNPLQAKLRKPFILSALQETTFGQDANCNRALHEQPSPGVVTSRIHKFPNPKDLYHGFNLTHDLGDQSLRSWSGPKQRRMREAMDKFFDEQLEAQRSGKTISTVVMAGHSHWIMDWMNFLKPDGSEFQNAKLNTGECLEVTVIRTVTADGPRYEYTEVVRNYRNYLAAKKKKPVTPAMKAANQWKAKTRNRAHTVSTVPTAWTSQYVDEQDVRKHFASDKAPNMLRKGSVREDWMPVPVTDDPAAHDSASSVHVNPGAPGYWSEVGGPLRAA